MLDVGDTYYVFDFEHRLKALKEDLQTRDFGVKCQLFTKGNSTKTFDSYNWNLSNMIFEMRERKQQGIFDVVYLDGAHALLHDGLAVCLLKELVKEGGFLILDDLFWSFAITPKSLEFALRNYTEEQAKDYQCFRVQELFLSNDPNFEKLSSPKAWRGVFWKKFPSINNKVNSQISTAFYRYFTARVDIKLMSTAGEFQILSMSDDRAGVWKPGWFQHGGIGYMIHSYVGKLEFAVKATVDGKIVLILRRINGGFTSGDNPKRIPYWIDYTLLTINGETIIDKLTPVWHDKPFFYTINAKADEEFIVQVEWLPHRSDDIDIVATPAPKPPVIDKAVAPPPKKLVTDKVVAPAPKPPVTDKANSQRFAARVDVKLMTTMGDFQILSLSEDKASVDKPAWFQTGGIGYQIQSCVEKLEFVVKATVDGQIWLNLSVMDSTLNETIDYTKLTVNGEAILNELTPVYYDKPYSYNMCAKADEEIKIQVEWLPHRNDT